MLKFTGLLVLAAGLLSAGNITFDGLAADNLIQQTANNPCVIGDNSCNEPAGMTYFASSGPQGTYDFKSPVYLATDPFTTYSGNLIPTSFSIGIDDNFAAGAGLEVLELFNVFSCSSALASSCTTLVASNSYTGPTTIPDNANGNGFSDATLNGFQLVAGTHYIFEAKVSNDTDGMEQFFIFNGGGSVISDTPEPTTMFLMGGGLLGIGVLLRRRRA